MFVIIGLVLLFSTVFGGYILAGGSMAPILHATPHELLVIGGAGIAALIIGSSLDGTKGVAAGLGRALGGPRNKKQDYIDVIVLVVKLFKLFKAEGAIALESHIEDPKSSAIFGEYPRLLKDKSLIHMIADTIRLLVTSNQPPKPEAVEDVLNLVIKAHHTAELKPVSALSSLSGALPALGIVACVLGVVKTMAQIDQPPAILGGLVGSALVGTFLGVFLAYGVVEPIGLRLAAIVEEDGEIYHVVKAALLGHIMEYPVPLIIEGARASINHHAQPTFGEVFDGLRAK